MGRRDTIARVRNHSVPFFLLLIHARMDALIFTDCPDPGFTTGAGRGSGRKASSSRGTSRGRGRGGKKAVSKPRSKTGAFRAADDDWD